VNFTTREDDNFVTPKVALPAMTPARGVSGTVALACGTASAAIYYTTNGTPPQASNNAAILYTVPITVPPGGFTLFVGAFKTDYFPSNVISASFTPT
jgi:hypothetical protein